MKILYFSPHPLLNLTDQTGYGTHMREVISGFKAQGHEVETLIAGGESPRNRNIQGTSGFTVKKILKRTLPNTIWNTLKDYQYINFDNQLLPLLKQKVEAFKPDFIYERGAALMASGAKIASMYNVPRIVEVNAPFWEEKIELEGNRLFKKRFNQREFQLLSEAKNIVVVSTPLKKYLSQKHRLPADRIRVIPNGVNADRIQMDADIEETLSHLIDPEATVIGFVGSIFPYHGVDRILKLLPGMRKEFGKVELLIVGDGEILPDLQGLSKSLGMEAYVHFTGSVGHSKVYSYIRAMDVTILPNTKWYCSPVKIFEYGILEKLVVAIDEPSVKDVVEHEKTAILFNREDKNGLEKALLEVMGNRTRYIDTGTAFSEKIKKEHTWQRVSEEIMNLFLQINHHE